MERTHIARRWRVQPNKLWRLWKKPSWEAKRLVLDRKRRQQRKLRALQQQLPDDVLAEHIFSKLSLQTLLHIRLTCKRWNRVISRRVFDRIEPRQSLVHILYRRRGKTIAVAHNPSTLDAVWRPIWWPRSPTNDGGWFGQVDGPFAVQVDEIYLNGVTSLSSRCSRVFTVHNLLTKKYHVIPEPACSESERRRSDRCMTLFGATKEEYKALMVTYITSLSGEDPTSLGASYFYTDLYTSATNSWRRINRTCLTDSDLGIEEGMDLPDMVHFGHGCFDGRFIFLTCSSYFSRHQKDGNRLWAFDLQQQTWTRIPTDMYGSQAAIVGIVGGFVRHINYVTCMGKLLAVVTDVTAVCEWENIADGEPMGMVSIFQLFGFPLQAVGTPSQCWKEISRMPSELMLCFNGIGLDENYVVNEVIYFSPSVDHGGLRSRFAVLYDLRENSWKKVSDSSNTVCSFTSGDTEYCVSVASDLVKYTEVQ